MRKGIALLLMVAVMVMAWPSAPVNAAGEQTIAQIAAGDSRFDTLVAALSAAGLVEVLNGPGPFTVFAPTDDAFAKLGTETINAVLADTDLLTSILLYHVVSGEVPASAVVTLRSATTVQGGDVLIRVKGGSVYLNGTVKVIITDIKAANGIIHVIDTVLLPSTGLDGDLFVVVRDTPVLENPAGDETGLVITTCKTVIVNAIWQNAAMVMTQGGWVSLNDLADVAETYGQPGGQPLISGCEGK